MTRIVPNQVNYNWLKPTALISSAMLYTSALVSLLMLVMKFCKIDDEDIIDYLNKGLAFMSIIYFLTDFCQSCIFHKAESLRNLDFIDNSFDTRFAQKNSTGYYSNDEVGTGIVKMGINNFENTFFTKTITGKMLNKQLWNFSVVVLLILVCVLTSTETLVVISQLALPFAIILQTFKLFIYHTKVEAIFYNYKEIFSKTNHDDLAPSIIKNVINYEKILSWAGIPTDTKIFNKMNADLSVQWEDIKKAHFKDEM